MGYDGRSSMYVDWYRYTFAINNHNTFSTTAIFGISHKSLRHKKWAKIKIFLYMLNGTEMRCIEYPSGTAPFFESIDYFRSLNHIN